MIPDQAAGASNGRIVKFQTTQDLSCKFFTCRSVGLKMIPAILISLFYHRLRYIMEKHGDTQKSVCFNLRKTLKNMLPYTVAVMRRILFCLHAGIKLRKEFPGKSCLPGCPKVIRMSRHQQLHKLRLDPLCADMLKISGHTGKRSLRIFFHLKTKLCGKSHCTKHTQSILCKTLYRISHTADDLFINVFHSAKQIHQTMFRMVRHGVNGKISSL